MGDRVAPAAELMTEFAQRTGVRGDRPGSRYLWTDAFAVCNLLGLAVATGDVAYRALALRLVARVHAVLGRHRADDTRTGWISGLGAREGEAHPTRGGLRIGKPLPERAVGARVDERLEWDRDGQYFHYLTKWMHALDQTARVTGQAMYADWARDLAAAAHRAFVYTPAKGSGLRMHWKMSIDLGRPQVASMGQHDPLDGLITCAQIEATAASLGATTSGVRLDAVAADFAAMIDPSRLATADPLGLGGLLVDAYRVAQLGRHGAWPYDDRLVEALLAAAVVGLRHYARQPDLRDPAAARLAFRELGLAIGLAAVERLRADAGCWAENTAATRTALEQLAQYAPVRTAIESFWLVPEHRRERAWSEHQNINEVMLATALAPEGFLVLSRPAAAA